MLAAANPLDASPRLGVRRLLKRRYLIRGCLFLATVVFLKWFVVLGVYAGFLPGADLFPRVDFSAFWAASSLALKGHAADAYELKWIWREQVQLPGNDDLYHPWRNPPIFFLIVLPLSFLPFAAAFAAWVMATGALALSAVCRMTSDRMLAGLLAVAFPATIGNILVGQNGLLTAGLFAWGMLLLRDRPQLAGALLGLMAFKPQFFPLVLVALVAGRQKHAAVSALVTTAVLSAVSLALFGLGAWEGFVSMGRLSADSIYSGDAPLAKMQSVSAALLLLGVPQLAVQTSQLFIAGACAAFVWWLWRREVPFEYRAAGLAVAILLATPYSYLYDLTLLGLAILWLAIRWSRDGWRPMYAELLVVAWLAPLSSPALHFFSIAPVVFLLLAAVIFSRTRLVPTMGQQMSCAVPVGAFTEEPAPQSA